jgi:hypothetical protein
MQIVELQQLRVSEIAHLLKGWDGIIEHTQRGAIPLKNWCAGRRHTPMLEHQF